MITRRMVLAMIGGPFTAQPQQKGKVYRIGYLSQLPPADRSSSLGQLRKGLHDVGYVEGQNVVVEDLWAAGKIDRLPALARELVRRQVDLIVTPGTPQSLAAKRATSAIPIVMVAVGDPIGNGLVASLARPGGNVTGATRPRGPGGRRRFSIVGSQLVGKQLEPLKEVVLKLTRVVVLRNPANPMHALVGREADVVAQALRVEIQIVETRSSDDFDHAFAAMTREHAGGLLVPADSVFQLHRNRLADLAIHSRLPTMFAQREFVEAGGLIAYSPDVADLFQRAAIYVDKIL
ncbi:MAG TPA: ABC transporter substrate-binding protein [Methylomirabilota bacterium]|nr:ABC transporter substrate-binding protein [Methylomirabilota bacterium]